MVLLVAKTLKTTIQKKSPKCARKIPVPEFRYSQTIFFLRFSVIVLMNLKLLILRNFILKLYLRSWFLLNLNCTHYILISVSPNFLYSNCLINFSDTFHYYCEGKIPKINRLNQCIKLDQIICLFITMTMKSFKNYRTRSAEHVQNLVFYFYVS